ncbi:hypothetical protein P3T76_016039 [Phytophthora citrophthora]|uniref:Uncharacterized protein n=1 Tax=Phytophthora citrophthora TaxID=4793 RepID=A0AAD9FY94_9STRA|nr:hypothetical protein P3T76_016039 [Phytophthora citrophthora]
MTSNKRSTRDLTSMERQQAVSALLARALGGKPTGTPIVKATTASQVNYWEMLIDKVLPAIEAKRLGEERREHDDSSRQCLPSHYG